MFGFFKKNKVLPTFAPLVTDMHCHILPLVDDGSKSLEESLEVMEAMKMTGFKEVKLTPHFQHPRFPNHKDDIIERFNNFCVEVEKNKGSRDLPKMTDVSGEYRVDDGFEDYVNDKELLTYHYANPDRGSDKGLLLIEFSLHQKRLGLDEVVFNRQMEGYDVILAHPERYPYFDGNGDGLEKLKEAGVLLQVNILSLDGFYGEEALHKGFDYIERGWVEFLGTDMHNVVYAEALKHASTNKKIIKLLETTEFENSLLVNQ